MTWMIRYERVFALLFLTTAIALACSGCATTSRTHRGSAGAAPTSKPTLATHKKPAHKTDPICFSREEVGRIEAFKVRCRSTLARVRAKAKHDLQTAQRKHSAAIQVCQERLNACHKQAQIKQTCPSCVKTAILAGVIAGGAALVVGVVAGAVATLAIQGKLPTQTQPMLYIATRP